MSIITLKKNSQEKHCRNHSNGNQGFSVWATTNSGQYNGSRIIPGFSSIPGCGYNSFCNNNPGAVKNTSGMLSNKLMGTRHGKLNTVKQYKNNNIQSEYTKSLHNNTNACYYNNNSKNNINLSEDSHLNTHAAIKANCESTSITIGNGRQIWVGNYVKTGNLAKNATGYEDYNTGKLIKNNCLDNNNNSKYNPKVKDNNGMLVSSNMKNSSSFRNVC